MSVRLPSWVRWSLGAVALALVVWFFVVPQFDGVGDALTVVRDLNPLRTTIGTALIAIAFVAQAQMTRVTLPPSQRPTLPEMVRIELAGAAVSHTVPGGTAAGTALGFRLLTQAGVSNPMAGFAVAVRGVGSALVLNVALWCALAVWIPRNGFRSQFWVVGAVGLTATMAAGAAAVAVVSARGSVVSVIARVAGIVPGVDRAEARDATGRIIDSLRDLLTDRTLGTRVAGWASIHWLAEAASLWIVMSAFGWAGDPLAVFVAFGVVNVIAVLPVTPRGLGVVEAVLIPMLIAFGAPGDIAAVGVLGWRLLSFWLPIPVGALSYLSLRVAPADVGPS